jgi:hypothetical protein
VSDPGQGSSAKTRKAALAAIAVLVLAACGVGGYLVGNSGGEDLDAARAAGARAGHDEGIRKGTQAGYAGGFRAGKRRGYLQAFAPAYKKAYIAAYGDSELEPPKPSEVSLPK